MQSAISPSSLSYPAYVHNVGLDTVADHDWMATGGITQNEIFDSNFIRLDYSLLYGLPDKVLEEVDTDGEDARRTPGRKFSSRLALRGTGRMSLLVCRLPAGLSPVVSGLADESRGVLVLVEQVTERSFRSSSTRLSS